MNNENEVLNTLRLQRQNSSTQITKPKTRSTFKVNTKSVAKTSNPTPPSDLLGQTCQEDVTSASGVTSEFKLLKKIAELTQVVHLLFQSSHQNETELSLLKERAVEEVDKLIEMHEKIVQDVTQDLALKQQKVEELEQKLAQMGSTSQASLRLVQYDLDQSRAENQSLREKCDELNQTIEKSREVNMSLAQELEASQELAVSSGFVASKLETEVERLTQKNQTLQGQKEELKEKLSTFESYSSQEKAELRSKLEGFELKDRQKTKEIESLKSKIAEMESTTAPESSLNEYKELKRQGTVVEMDENLEIARLKRELRQAKLELQNRESNFNRVFSDSRPVHVTSADPNSSSLAKNGWLPNISQPRVKSERSPDLLANRKGIEINSPLHNTRIRVAPNPKTTLTQTGSITSVQKHGQEGLQFKKLGRKTSSYF